MRTDSRKKGIIKGKHMSIFQPAQKTDIQHIIELNAEILLALENHARQSFNLAWKKLDDHHVLVIKSKEEAQELFTALGADGGRAMAAHAKEQELLMMISNWSPLIPPYAYSIDADGNVTIGDLLV